MCQVKSFFKTSNNPSAFRLVRPLFFQKTLTRFTKRIDQLYEQGTDLVRIRQYVRKWVRGSYVSRCLLH